LNRAGTLTDLKKLILFEMLEARDFYFLPDQFGVETVDEILDLVRSERCAAVREVFTRHKERSLEILDKSLSDRCGQ
jgi:DNA-binding GntR family transcriptional regulator